MTNDNLYDPFELQLNVDRFTLCVKENDYAVALSIIGKYFPNFDPLRETYDEYFYNSLIKE